MTESFGPPLSSEHIALLRRIIGRHEPELLALVETVGVNPLSEADREALRLTIMREFLCTGLDSDDEPTPWGLQLEQLIDVLGRY
jgi:hypothetical protein